MPSNVLECSKFVHKRKYSLYELWRFVYILGHVTLHVESIAQKVNCYIFLVFLVLRRAYTMRQKHATCDKIALCKRVYLCDMQLLHAVAGKFERSILVHTSYQQVTLVGGMLSGVLILKPEFARRFEYPWRHS